MQYKRDLSECSFSGYGRALILFIASLLILNCGGIDGSIYKKYINVFGLHIYATEKTDDRKIIHTANIMAEYLDNNEDGLVDDPEVHDKLKKSNACLTMFENEAEMESIFEGPGLFTVLCPGSRASQNLTAAETHPEFNALQKAAKSRLAIPMPSTGNFNNKALIMFDASYEEVLHLLTDYGYVLAYPAAFGIKKEEPSLLTKAMDIARGGRFDEPPNSYPPGAWYTYDDATCKYSCNATEYFYWGLTSILGAQDYPGRLSQISKEWNLNTREKVQETDKALFPLLTDPQYKLPMQLPDGRYRPNDQPENFIVDKDQ